MFKGPKLGVNSTYPEFPSTELLYPTMITNCPLIIDMLYTKKFKLLLKLEVLKLRVFRIYE
jgi:hypothetical protein